MRQSFWLTRRLEPSDTTIAESPPGPSVIDVSTWIAIVRPGASSISVAVGRADELGEPELAQRALLFVRRVSGQQDRDVAPQVRAQPRFVVVIGVQMGDVEVVGVLDPVEQVSVELIVAGEDEPRAEERRHEPRVAQDRPGGGLDEDAGVADRGRAHAPARQATGGSVYC